MFLLHSLVRVAELQGTTESGQTGFVTFKSVKAAANASKMLKTAENTSGYAVKAAPHPEDVYWPNMNVYGKEVCALLVETF